MCGRTCCTLDKNLVPYACSVVTRKLPTWKEAPCGGMHTLHRKFIEFLSLASSIHFFMIVLGEYVPSTNCPPTAYTPILYAGKESPETEKSLGKFLIEEAWKYPFQNLIFGLFFKLFNLCYGEWFHFGIMATFQRHIN